MPRIETNMQIFLDFLTKIVWKKMDKKNNQKQSNPTSYTATQKRKSTKMCCLTDLYPGEKQTTENT